MILRPYQETMIEQLREETMAGRNPVVVAPCGSGKGSLIAYIVNGAVQRKHKVIFAVHGKSLVIDMSERVAKLGIPHGVLLGGEPRQRWHSVQVASIDTLHRMPHPPEASLLICDEVHMALSPTWRKTLDRYPNARVIGATATPIRLDGKGLGRATGGLFDSMVLGPSEEELIGMGHLVGSRVLAPPPPDLGSVKKTAGEFNSKELASVCDKTKLLGDIVEHWKKHGNRKTAAFGVDKAHAAHITDSFRAAGIQWAYVDADTSTQDRADIWKDLDNPTSGLMGVSSVGCISVGWDHPVVECLISARPTASLGLWKQMLGRGSRPHPGKTHFLVLDHSGNTHRHAPYGMFEDAVPWSLDGAAVRETGKKPPAVATCKHSYRWPDGTVQHPCYATFKAGPKDCPFCGMPLKVEARKIEVQAGQLQEITRAQIRMDLTHRTPEEKLKRDYYESLLQKCEDRGKTAGVAAFMYQKRFGSWPDKQWRVEWLSKRLKEEVAG